MLMRYHCGRGVGHSCAHRQASSGSDQPGLEDIVAEAPKDDNEHDSSAVVPVPDEQIMPPDLGEASSTDEEDEEPGSDASLRWTDDDKCAEQDEDSEDDIEDEEVYEMEEMYGH